MTKPSQQNDTPLTPRQSMLNRLIIVSRRVPWWIVMLMVVLFIALISIINSERNQDILDTMLDRPRVSTDNKFDAVYQVESPVKVIAHTLVLRMADGSRVTIDNERVEQRLEGTLVCDKDNDPDCLDEYGELVQFRVPLIAEEYANLTADGVTVEQGVLRPLGIAIDLPNGELLPVTDTITIISQETGTLLCDPRIDVDCEDLSGEVVTFSIPYELQIGLLTREDIHIQHVSDGYQEVVRPNRVSDIKQVVCTRAKEAFCYDEQLTIAAYEQRITGTEINRADNNAFVRTVDEETVFIATERIQDRTETTITCNRDANPRCQDFAGVLIQQTGAVIVGELTLETNRTLSIISQDDDTAIEYNKSNIVQDERIPANCRVEDEGQCLITIQLVDSTVGGRILSEDESGILLQTIAPEVMTVDLTNAEVIRRTPDVCALNNLRGCNEGIWLTLLVTISSYSIALMVGLLIGMMRVSSNPLLYHLSTFYVEVIRGTPLLVLLFVFAFVVGPWIGETEDISINLLITEFSLPIGTVTQPIYDFMNTIEVQVLGKESFLSEAILGLAVGYAAFLAEVFRAGIQSIGKGQMEAARSLGMSYFQAMRKVILPQAVRVILPPLGNDFIALLKDSTLISALALADMLLVGQQYIANTFQTTPVYVMVALLYILLTLFLSMIVRTVEKRIKIP